METLLSLLTGGLFATAIYLLLKRSMIRQVIGLVLLSNASVLMVFTLGRVTRGEPPVLAAEGGLAPEALANPLAQALILTAIVINFGLLAFALSLAYRIHKAADTVDSDRLRAADLAAGDERPLEEAAER